MERDIQVNRINDEFKNHFIKCKYCQKKRELKPIYFPPEFYCRLINNRKDNIFKGTIKPVVAPYRPKKFIQYSNKLNHFRCISQLSQQKIKIYDGIQTYTKIEQDIETILTQSDWINFFIVYQIKNQKDYNQNILYKQIQALKFQRMLVGGSDPPNLLNQNMNSNIRQMRQDFRQTIRRQQLDYIRNTTRYQNMVNQKINQVIQNHIVPLQQLLATVIDKFQTIQKRIQNIQIELQKEKKSKKNEEKYYINQKQLNKKEQIKNNQQQIKKDKKRQNQHINKQQNQKKNTSQSTQKPKRGKKSKNNIFQSEQKKNLLTSHQQQKQQNNKIVEIKQNQINPGQKKQSKSQRKYRIDFSQEKLKKSIVNKNGSSNNQTYIEQRKKIVGGVFMNACSFVSAIDLLKKSRWMQIIIQSENTKKYPQLIKCLSGNKLASYSQAIAEIRDYCQKQKIQLNPQGQYEDPYLIVNIIQNIMTIQTKGKNSEPIYPVSRCACQQDQDILGNLEYLRGKSEQKFSLVRIFQCSCGNKNDFIEVYHPEQYIIRLNDTLRQSSFRPTHIPLPPGYYPSGVIQYNSVLQHFRVLKNPKPWEMQFCDFLQTRVITKQEKDYQMANPQWSNYIIMVKKSLKKPAQIYGKQIIKSFQTKQIPRIIVGGSINSIKHYKIGHWNINSINSNKDRKLQILNKSKIDIMSVQQPRQSFQLKKYIGYFSEYTQTQNNGKKLNASLFIKDQFQSNLVKKGQDYVIVQIKDSNVRILAISFYNRLKQSFQNKYQMLQIIENQIQQKLEDNDQTVVIICTDLNKQHQQIFLQRQKYPLFDLLEKLYFPKLVSTVKAPNSNKNRQIDFIFQNIPIQSTRLITYPGQCRADHGFIQNSFTIKQYQNQQMDITIPNKQFSNKLYQMLILSQNDLQDVHLIYNKIISSGISLEKTISKNNLREKRIQRKQVHQILQEKWLDNKRQKYKQNLNKTLKEKNPKIKFKNLKRLLGYEHFQKKQSSILHSAIGPDGTIVYGDQLQKLILTGYQENHKDSSYIQKFQDLKFPSLNISTNKIINACKKITKDKAHSWDGINKRFFEIYTDCKKQKPCKKCHRKLKLLKIWTTSQYWSNSQTDIHFLSRIIPLSKDFPKITSWERFKPIIITSFLVKFLQHLFTPELSRYMQKNGNTHQYGFCKKIGISESKRAVFKSICQLRANKIKPIIMCFDISSAYDNICRQDLYKKLQQKSIIENKYINLLKYIHKKTKIKLKNYCISIEKGLIQGIISSPEFFNLILKDMVKDLSSKGFKIFLYADYIIGITENQEQLGKLIDEIQQDLDFLGLSVNKSKSKIMRILKKRSSKDVNRIFKGYQYCESLKYLGSQWNSTLNPSFHFQQINNKVNYIMHKMFNIRKKKDIQLNRMYYKIFVMPHYMMLASTFDLLEAHHKQRIIIQMRLSLKKFCLLPKSTPNKFIKKIIVFQALFTSFAKISQHKLQMKVERLNIDFLYLQKIKEKSKQSEFLNIPTQICSIIRQTYGKICEDHRTICSENHLKHHGIYIDIDKLFGKKKRKSMVFRKIRRNLKTVI